MKEQIIRSLSYEQTYFVHCNAGPVGGPCWPRSERRAKCGFASSGHSRSSGFVWRSELVVAADEAFSEAGEYTVGLWNGDIVAAQLVGRDPSTDVALLRIDRSDLQPISLTASKADVGALAIAVGAEDGTPTTALGMVSRNTGSWRSLAEARSTRG